MKYIYTILFVLITCTSCKNETLLAFETLKIEENKCNTCPVITIDIPKAIDKNAIGNSINNALKEEIITLLNFDDTTNINSIKTAVSSFNKAFNQLKDKFPEESTKWEAIINGEILYEDKTILTIALDSYIFTGGAHGYSVKKYLNFNKKTGEEIENWQLFNTDFNFEKFAETKFRIQENIPQNSPINATGFMFENDTFNLPENIGYTEKGLQLIYNQYEVSTFAEGPIELNIPFNEAKKYLAFKVK